MLVRKIERLATDIRSTTLQRRSDDSARLGEERRLKAERLARQREQELERLERDRGAGESEGGGWGGEARQRCGGYDACGLMLMILQHGGKRS